MDKKRRFVIRDNFGNYPFERNKHQSAVKLCGGPVHTYESYEAAEERLREHLFDDWWDELRDEYSIEEVE